MRGLDAFSAALGQELDAKMIKDLVDQKVNEDERLDYKGDWFGSKAKKGNGPQQWLRRAVNAFANAEGSVLLIGVNGGDVREDEEPWAILGMSGMDGDAFRKWAAEVLKDFTPYITYPVVGTVDVDGVLVGYVAVRQASVFFRYAEGKRTVGYYRLHDGNFPAPEYVEAFITDSLYADLILRRRHQTQLELGVEAYALEQQGRFQLTVSVKNLSPLVARDVAITLVRAHRDGDLTEIPDSLQPRIQKFVHSAFPGLVVEEGRFIKGSPDLTQDGGVLAPFGERRLSWILDVSRRGVWKAALVCTSATSLPSYWQLSLRFHPSQWRVIQVDFDRCGDDQPALVGQGHT